MKRIVILSMLVVVMGAKAFAATADATGVEKEKLSKDEYVMQSRSRADHEEIEIAALHIAEMIDRGLYEDIWDSIAPSLRDGLDYDQTRKSLAAIRKMLNPLESRRLLSSGFVKGDLEQMPRGRYAKVHYCVETDGLMILQEVTLLFDAANRWYMAGVNVEFFQHAAGDGTAEVGSEQVVCAPPEAAGLKAEVWQDRHPGLG
jgi:hypothetical protein